MELLCSATSGEPGGSVISHFLQKHGETCQREEARPSPARTVLEVHKHLAARFPRLQLSSPALHIHCCLPGASSQSTASHRDRWGRGAARPKDRQGTWALLPPPQQQLAEPTAESGWGKEGRLLGGITEPLPHHALGEALTQGRSVEQAVPITRGGQGKQPLAAGIHVRPPVQTTWGNI